MLGRNKRLRQLIAEAYRRTKETGGIPFSQIVAELESREASRKKRPTRTNHPER